MKKILLIILAALLPSVGLGAGSVHLDKANIDLTDNESLQRGARTFVRYCYSCHGIQFVRFNRLGQDLGFDDATLKAEFMLTADKVGEQMKVALGAKDGAAYFGTNVPDLSLTSRSRGVDWLYTYLRTFYLDSSRPLGVNNVVFPDVAMPHVLWELQGFQRAIKADDDPKKVEQLEIVQPGSMSAEEYDNTVRDLVNFLSYVGEPIQVERKQLGLWVLIFLGVFTVFAYMLKKEYWKDIH